VPNVAELNRDIAQKQGELDALFKKHRQGESYDMPVEVVEEINRRNDELTALGKSRDQAVKLADIESRNEAALKDAKKPANAPGFQGRRQDEDEDRPARPVSLGKQFLASNAYKGYARGSGVGPVAVLGDVDVKTLFSTSAGWAPETTRTNVVTLYPTQGVAIADIVPIGATSQSAVLYMEETTFTNSAAEAAEGAAYGESALALTERTSTVRKIATFLPVTDEQLEDEARAESYVNNRLPFMLRQRLDQQLLTGDGSAPNLRGFLNVSGIQTQAKGSDPIPDAIYKGIVKVRYTGFSEPDAVVFHPNNWQSVRLLRTQDGIYIWGQPTDAGPERIWGLPVVQSTYETENTALVGAFRAHTELVIRRGVEIQVSNSHSTYFVEGKLAIRADMRAALCVYRPKALCSVTGLG
jgi:HK97 family phage major capsid protein